MSTPHLLPNGRVLRYSFHERLVHWMAGISYVYLLLTGLAFWSPWLFWIAAALGGAAVSSQLHPWAGLVFVLAVVRMYQLWGAQMKKTPADKAWLEAMPHYVRNEDESMPSVDRFNPGQKILFWGFWWCGLLLLLSGIILWFTDAIPWSLRFLRYFAVIVHPVAALLTIGLFIIHVYMGTAAERGAFGSVVRGDVSRAWAKRHHQSWYESIVGESSAKK
ncbi:MAG: formate dehydrogenase subunit gamma [Acidobacteriia bacterium]|nr:formate dehydrogenase subunit gamma [Terriglobia bacterium]